MIFHGESPIDILFAVLSSQTNKQWRKKRRRKKYQNIVRSEVENTAGTKKEWNIYFDSYSFKVNVMVDGDKTKWKEADNVGSGPSLKTIDLFVGYKPD